MGIFLWSRSAVARRAVRGSFMVSAVLAASAVVSATPASAQPAPTLEFNQSSGAPGATVVATISGLPPADTVALTFFNGGTGFQGYCKADSSGSCQLPETVPYGPSGTYSVEAVDSSGVEATAPFTITPVVTLDPTSGLAGSTVSVAVAGFAAAETVGISSGPLVPAVGVGSCTTDSDGSCTTTYVVPTGFVGPESVSALGSTSHLQAKTLFVEQPGPATFTLSAPSGAVGSTLTATAGGFAGDETVSFSLNGIAMGSCATAADSGHCVASVVVPSVPSGTYDVSANGADGDNATTALAVEPSIMPSVPAGPAGSSITLTAAGFEPSEVVNVSYEGSPVGSCSADPTGSCPLTLTVPSGNLGPYLLVAAGATSGLMATDTFYEVGPLSLFLAPSPSGGLDATASGFEPNEVVDISFTPMSTTTPVVAECTADITGTCSVVVSLPDQPAGPVTYTATGSNSGFTTTATYVTSPGIGASPDAGPAGSTVYLEAAHFAADQTVQFVLDGDSVGSCLTDAEGDCAVTAAKVPAVPSGNDQLVATDQNGNVASGTFVVVPSVVLSPQTGPAGASLTATVDGFGPGETVDLSYASAPVGSCTAASNGSCPVTFAVPAEHAGSYTVSAAGMTSGLTATANFAETPTLTVNPDAAPGTSTVDVSVGGFTSGEVVKISFDEPIATTVGSCTADENGDCSAAVPVPSLPGGAYYFSVNGETSGNWAVTKFQVIPTLSLSPASASPGQSVTAEVTGFGAFESVDVSMAGAALGSCVTNANGVCATGVVVPKVPGGPTSAMASGVETGLTASTPFTVIVPTVTSISPNNGKLAGGTTVTITGANFTNPATVQFGAKAATAVTVVNSTTITARSPAGSGSVDVTVATPGGTSATSPGDVFTYLGTPTITAVSPGFGGQKGGTSVTISGSNIANPVTVYFGGTVASMVTVVNSSTITATTPAGTGTVNVKVITLNGTSATVTADRFKYLPPPTVTRVAPAKGASSGGTTVVLTGTNFAAPATVAFGGVDATNVDVLSANRISATSPAGVVGTVDVTVETPGGTSSTSSADHFVYSSTG